MYFGNYQHKYSCDAHICMHIMGFVWYCIRTNVVVELSKLLIGFTSKNQFGKFSLHQSGNLGYPLFGTPHHLGYNLKFLDALYPSNIIFQIICKIDKVFDGPLFLKLFSRSFENIEMPSLFLNLTLSQFLKLYSDEILI